MSIRPVKKILKAQPTIEGAGVNLRRAIGFGDPSEVDPFLLLDDFRNERPEDYLAGFPWHPHRGIETITYVLAGSVEHGDSIGNKGVISSGDVQWMTAGSGIIHQEMPKGDQVGRMHGFQLWANLPAALKMTKPRYQEIKSADMPEVTDDDGTHVRIVCGNFWGKTRSLLMALLLILYTSMFPFLLVKENHYLLTQEIMHLHMFSQAPGNSAMLQARLLYLRKVLAGWILIHR